MDCQQTRGSFLPSLPSLIRLPERRQLTFPPFYVLICSCEFKGFHLSASSRQRSSVRSARGLRSPSGPQHSDVLPAWFSCRGHVASPPPPAPHTGLFGIPSEMLTRVTELSQQARSRARLPALSFGVERDLHQSGRRKRPVTTRPQLLAVRPPARFCCCHRCGGWFRRDSSQTGVTRDRLLPACCSSTRAQRERKGASEEC